MTVSVEIVRLDAAIADVLVHAEFDSPPAEGTELRGRLMGPRCPGVGTIEVAYPLRPLPADGPNRRSARVVIPDPNLWEPGQPFVYWGPIELCLDGQAIEQTTVEVGLRKSQR